MWFWLVNCKFKTDIAQIQFLIFQEETQLAKEKDAFNKQLKTLNLVLPQLSADKMCF